MLLSDFDYDLPSDSIAQRPPAVRDAARMLLLDRQAGRYGDASFVDLPALLRGDELIIVNNARVIPARLFGRRIGVRAEAPGRQSAAKSEFVRARIEVLLVRRLEENQWEAL